MTTFETAGIRPELVNYLMKMGVVQPTPIQERAIPALLKGQDVIAQAQTGTGKTLAFLLPMLEQIDVTKSVVQGVVITPTRELALQIHDEAKKLAPAVGAKVLAAYGGQDVAAQIHKLKGAIHLVIGTPGRLLDHLARGTVDFGDISTLVLDEADQMLHMGFLREVERIIDQMNQDRQTLLFSATMPPEIRSVAAKYMKQPVEIRVQAQRITLDEIQQIVIETSDRDKQESLVEMINQYNPYLAIIFCRTKRRASALNEALLAMGYDSDELHGDLTQAKREKVMKRFRDAKIQLLVATDVAARGLDVGGVSHVFNYDIPQDAESYIHRIGRTGRAGEKGIAVTFVAPRDREALRLIEQSIKQTISKQTTDGRKLQDRPQDAGGGAGAKQSRFGDKPGRGGKGFKSDKPGRGDKPFKGDRQGRGDKPAWSDKSAREDKPFRGEKPGRGDKPAWSDKSARGDKPGRGDKQGRGDKPAWSDKPGRGGGDKPAWSEKPGRGGGDKPAWSDKPGRGGGGDKPAWSDRPGVGGGDKPAWSEKPGRGGDKPAWSDKPGRGGDKPAWSDKPGRGGDKPARPSKPRPEWDKPAQKPYRTDKDIPNRGDAPAARGAETGRGRTQGGGQGGRAGKTQFSGPRNRRGR